MTGVRATLAVTLAWGAIFLAAQVLLEGLAPDLAGSLYGQLTLCSLYAVGLLQAILWLQRRSEQPAAVAAPAPAPAAERRAVWLSLGGGAGGSILWIFPLCWLARDWAIAVATLAVCGAIVAVGLRAALHAPERYDRIARAVFAGLGTWSLAAVNLRWSAWMEAYRRSGWAEGSIELPLWAMNALLVATIAHVLYSLRRHPPRRSTAT